MLLVITINAPFSSPVHDDSKHRESPAIQNNGRKGGAKTGLVQTTMEFLFLTSLIMSFGGRPVSEIGQSNIPMHRTKIGSAFLEFCYSNNRR